MIYQCYPKKEHQSKLFTEEPYKGFGLEFPVNKRIAKNCPELETMTNRLQLTEYACFLWHWRNPSYDTDSWFGTTSYRQLEKFPHIFKSKKEIEELLVDTPILAWGEYRLIAGTRDPSPDFLASLNVAASDVPEGSLLAREATLREQCDICHHGLNEYIEFMLPKFGHSVPDGWYKECTGFFANYWVMNKDLFNDFMEFSWPMVKWSLDNIHITHYYHIQQNYGTVSNAKATGYFMERLFMLWYLIRGLKPHNPSNPEDLFNNLGRARDPKKIETANKVK